MRGGGGLPAGPRGPGRRPGHGRAAGPPDQDQALATTSP